MVEFIKANLYDIVFIIAIIGVIMIMLRQGARSKVNRMLLYFVTEAEAQYGGGTGELKFSAVTTWLYEHMPPLARLLFTAKQIDELIELAVTNMKLYLENNVEAKVLIVGEVEKLE